MGKIREFAINLAKEKKYDEAIMLFIKADEFGDKDAKNDLGVLYEMIDRYKEAFELYEISYKNGSMVSAYNLGNCYEQGLYVEKDDNKAFEYYQISAKMGYSLAYIKLSKCYLYGIGTKKDEKKSFEAIKKGAKKSLDCLSQLAYYHSSGIGVKPSQKKFYKYSKMSAIKGNTLGIYNLGVCCLFGEGCKMDIDKAINYFHIAAERKYADAFYRLGEIFASDKYDLYDPQLSNYYYYKSIELNSPRGLLKVAEDLLTKLNDVYYIDKERLLKNAVMLLIDFLNTVDYTYENELIQYNTLKEKFKNDIDWDLLETDPSNYLSDINNYFS